MSLLNKLPTMKPILGSTLLVCALGIAQLGIVSAAPTDQTLFEDFESINSDNFTLGTDRTTARFTNGFSAFAGITELYNGGNHAWMVNPGKTGQIEFETNASEVEFFARTRSIANGTSILSAFDEQDIQVGDSVILNPGDPFQLVKFTGSIRRIEFINNANSDCNNCMNAIDDFGFSSVPAASLSLPIRVNQTNFSTGDTLSLDIGASNPGLPTLVDVYLVILLPDGNTLINFTDLEATFSLGNLSSLADLVPLATTLDLANAFSVDFPAFFTNEWTGRELVGDYTIFFVMVQAGSLRDGTIDANDIVELGSAGFSFNQ